ncbi:hypothetical protein LTR53_010833 [Teratosphaeriaceae sp. CCFEE 6253]|nr:hypothetical protein LTR53_010833 [Teratosphaeriaceae sp. CCFEE 6253]
MPAQDNTIAQDDHVGKLKAAIAGEKSKSTFACGGKLAIDDIGAARDKNENAKPTAHAVTIRFGPHGHGSTLTLPSGGDVEAFEKLLNACTPASFGKGGKEVLDDEYRKAAKLDSNDFCSDFCPYTTGIVNIVNQLLVPSIGESRSVKAELYKLNIYSGPSGKFKSHVDTPRSETHVGSLVVALPSAFKGGNLSVRHGDEQTVFAWAVDSATSVHWAAFYSDCEHEVNEVTSGHRVTLTYNLFLIPRIDLQAGTPLSLDAKNLPLADLLRSALSDARFMMKGGEIGVYLAHRYPHTHKVLSQLLPRCLKGADMAVYEVARALGLRESLINTNKAAKAWHYHGGCYGEEDSEGGELVPFGSYYPRLKTLEVGSEVGDDDDGDDMGDARITYRGRFFWLNKPSYKELSSASLYYGNEPGLDTQYVSAALLIVIPSAEDRVASGYLSQGKYYEALDELEGSMEDEDGDEGSGKEWEDEEMGDV